MECPLIFSLLMACFVNIASAQQPCGSCADGRFPICKNSNTIVKPRKSGRACCEDMSYPICDDGTPDGRPVIPFDNPSSFECNSQGCQGRIAKIAARNAQTISHSNFSTYGWTCQHTCSMVNGFYLHNGEWITDAVEEFHADSTTCGPGFECVDECCVLCRSGQICPGGSISKWQSDSADRALTTNFFATNAIPDGKRPRFEPDNSRIAMEDCPSGMMCNTGKMPIDCDERVDRYRTLSGTNQSPLDGSLCDAGSMQLSRCPAGYYCSNSSVAIICPEGYFCPELTKVPIRCKGNWWDDDRRGCSTGESVDSDRYCRQLLMFMGLAIATVVTRTIVTQRHLITPGTNASVPTAVISMEMAQVGAGRPVQCRNEDHRNDKANDADSDDEDNTARLERVDIQFQDLSLDVTLPGGKTKCIVQGATGHMKAGTTTALMGASGAGKTSLLNALCGRAYYGTTTGTIFLNGQESTIKDHKSLIGFVPQADDVHPYLSVFESLVFSGLFRLSNRVSLSSIRNMAIDMLRLLELYDVRDSLVGEPGGTIRGVSGGQRKRVSIGVELMAKPRVLFLDEPTSGLDSNAAQKACDALARLACQGVNVICVIHQPRFSIYSQFDQVFLLAQGGHTVFVGTPLNAVGYFEALGYEFPLSENIADVLLDISTGTIATKSVNESPLSSGHTECKVRVEDDKVEECITGDTRSEDKVRAQRRKMLVDAWKQSGPRLFVPVIRSTLPGNVQKRNIAQQFAIMVLRILIERTRAWQVVLVDLILILVQGYACCLATGELLYTESQCSYEAIVFERAMLLGVCFSILTAIPVLRTFGDHQCIMYREMGCGYSFAVFFLAGNVIDFLYFSCYSTCVAIIVWELNKSAVQFANFLLMFWGLAWTQTGWGYLISAVLPRENTTLATGLFIALTGIIFGGTMSFYSYQDIYKNIGSEIAIGSMSGTRWFVEWMAVAEFRTRPAQYGVTGTVETVAERAAAASDTELAANIQVHCLMSQFQEYTIAYHDLETATTQSYEGWWWPVPWVMFIGTCLRILTYLCFVLSSHHRKRMNRPVLSTYCANFS